MSSSSSSSIAKGKGRMMKRVKAIPKEVAKRSKAEDKKEEEEDERDRPGPSKKAIAVVVNNNNKNKQKDLLDLPNELLLKILRYVPVDDLAGNVSRIQNLRLQDLCRHPSFWSAIFPHCVSSYQRVIFMAGPNLRKLKISFCGSITDLLILALESCPNLQHLEITRGTFEMKKLLQAIRISGQSLRKLSLVDIYPFPHKTLISNARCLSRLTGFDLAYGDGPRYNENAHHRKDLECSNLDAAMLFRDYLSVVAKLPGVRKLALTGLGNYSDWIVRAFQLQRLHHLTEVTVDVGVNDAALLAVAKSCPGLVKMRLEKKTGLLTEEGLREVIRKCEQLECLEIVGMMTKATAQEMITAEGILRGIVDRPALKVTIS